MRLHFFEFMDQHWFPSMLRDSMTEYLDFIIEKGKIYEGLIVWLAKAMEETGKTRLIDLGSGSGGGMIYIIKHLTSTGKKYDAVLTDLYPALESFEKKKDPSLPIRYHPIPVNSSKVPEDLKGMRTLFNAFHHMKPDDARNVLEDACRSGEPIIVIEINDPGIIELFSMVFIVPIIVLAVTPFIKPFRFSRIFFTYFIPILPPLIAWDGFISLLRIYSISDMLRMTGTLKCRGFQWSSGKIKSGKGKLLFLYGRPA